MGPRWLLNTPAPITGMTMNCETSQRPPPNPNPFRTGVEMRRH
jgi:hypothetical protein